MEKTRTVLVIILLTSILSGCVHYLFTTPGVLTAAIPGNMDFSYNSAPFWSKSSDKIYFMARRIPYTCKITKAEGMVQLLSPIDADCSYNPSQPCIYEIVEVELKKEGRPKRVSLIPHVLMKCSLKISKSSEIPDSFHSFTNYILSKADSISDKYTLAGKEVSLDILKTVIKDKLIDNMITKVETDSYSEPSRDVEVIYSPDRTKYIKYSPSLFLDIFDKSGELINRINPHYFEEYLGCELSMRISFSPDNSKLAFWGNNRVCIFDLKDQRVGNLLLMKERQVISRKSWATDYKK